MAWDFSDVGSGAAAGASAGSAFGPWGTAIGGVVGAIGGGLMSRPKAPDFSDLIQQRQQQINQFQAQLTQAQNTVLSNYQNLQTNTLNRFMPDASAYLAGRGLSSSGGAFASAVAHEATGLQGQYDAMSANMTEQNLNTIGSMQQNAFNSTLGISTQPSLLNYAQSLSRQQGFGSILGSLGSFGLKQGMSNGSWNFGPKPDMSAGPGTGLWG